MGRERDERMSLVQIARTPTLSSDLVFPAVTIATK